MDKALYIAMTGAKHNMQAQSVHANNLANANTSGFKQDMVLARSQAIPAGPGMYDSRAFATVQGTTTDFSTGPLIETGRDLDVSIDGDSWLAIQDAQGKEVYTRSASLTVDLNGQLRTDKGDIVVGNGGPIALPPYESVEIGVDGSVTVRGKGQGPEVLVTVDRLKLVTPDPKDLVKNADGYIELKNNAAANPDPAARVVSGFIEGSNVNTVNAMVEMLALSRQYETQVKMMQTVGEANEQSSRMMQI
jgi:flagellar basal-body rod protein FlgF